MQNFTVSSTFICLLAVAMQLLLKLQAVIANAAILSHAA